MARTLQWSQLLSDTDRYSILLFWQQAALYCWLLLDYALRQGRMAVKGREAVYFTLDWQPALMYLSWNWCWCFLSSCPKWSMQVLLLQLRLLHSSSFHGGSFYNTCSEAGYSLYRHMRLPLRAVRFVLNGVLWIYVRWPLYKRLLKLRLIGGAGVCFLLWIYQAGSHYLNWNVLQVPEYSVAPEPPNPL